MKTALLLIAIAVVSAALAAAAARRFDVDTETPISDIVCSGAGGRDCHVQSRCSTQTACQEHWKRMRMACEDQQGTLICRPTTNQGDTHASCALTTP